MTTMQNDLDNFVTGTLTLLTAPIGVVIVLAVAYLLWVARR